MIALSRDLHKEEVFDAVERFVVERGFDVVDEDRGRPWGGFLIVDERQAIEFARAFFPRSSEEELRGFEKLSPKVLVVAPGRRLSWQYHRRRAEIWRLIGGRAGVVLSETDEETPVRELSEGEAVTVGRGERHRLVGLDGWGVLAEIWKHTDPERPSDEEDIVRLDDDFGR